MSRARTIVHLKRGDITDLARALGRSPSHLSRVIAGNRPASAELRGNIEELTGVPLANLRLPGRGWRKGRKQTASHRAAIADGQRRRHARNKENN